MSETDMAKIARLVADPHAEAVAAKDKQIAAKEKHLKERNREYDDLVVQIAALRSVARKAKSLAESHIRLADIRKWEDAWSHSARELDAAARAALEMSGGVL